MRVSLARARVTRDAMVSPCFAALRTDGLFLAEASDPSTAVAGAREWPTPAHLDESAESRNAASDSQGASEIHRGFPSHPTRVRAMKDGWPDLATQGWLDTATTLHLWSQIVGKTRLSLEPMVNHWWQVPLYVTPRGLTTSLLGDGVHAFEVELDLVGHALRVREATGSDGSFPLEPMSVAEFYRRYRAALASIGVELRIRPRPVEVPTSIRFDEDVIDRTYDPAWATRFTTALQCVDPLLEEFRGGFLGKASPVHFFWGASTSP